MKNRVLVYGMHGYRNLGAESRLVSIVEQLRRMVPAAEVVTNTMHRTALDYLRDRATVSYFHPALYRPASNRLIESADAVVLSEGAFIGDHFSPALNSATVNAIEQARNRGVASIGLALDSQPLSERRRRRTVEALNGTTLMTVRAAGARRELEQMGVTVPLRVTADCAVSMPLPDQRVHDAVRARFGTAEGPVHAIAPVDFYMWPAVLRPLARPSDVVRWPYAGTYPDRGRERSAQLVREWADHARHLLSSDRRAKVLIVLMDRGDVRIGQRIQAAIGMPERVLVLNGQESNPAEVSAALAQSVTLTSSRYHAIVLASAHAVPHVALGHDNRTRFFSEELGVERFFVPHDASDVVPALRERHERLMEERDEAREQIARGFQDMRARDAINYAMLGDALESLGYAVERVPEQEPARTT